MDKGIESVMWRRQNVQADATGFSSPARERFPLCHGCSKWIMKTIATTFHNRGDAGRALVAGPVRISARESEARCFFCRALLQGPASVIGLDSAVNGDAESIMTTGLCPSCDQWLVNLAVDSRSVRNVAKRQSEGDYGLVLHPNLQRVHASFVTQNESLDVAVREACEQLGISVAAASAATAVDVLFVEAAGDGASLQTVRTAHPSAKVIVLARAEASSELREAIIAGADDWVTVPFTPQQIVGALQRVTTHLSHPVQWDLETWVPRIHNLETTRPAIVVTPAPNVDPLLVAWSLRRFARGYDDLLMVDGHLLLLPLARPEYQWNIIERLTVVMGERAVFLPYEAPHTVRFEASA